MASTQADMEDSVWQGYVGAVSSLLLSLLLLFALVVLAIVTLGQLKFDDIPGAQVITDPDVTVVEAIDPRVLEMAAPIPDVLTPVSAQWVLRFPDQTVEIASDFYAVIAREIFAEFPATDRTHKWLLRTPAHADSTYESRVAFLRLFAARQFLISEGVVPADIEVRIVDPALASPMQGSMPVLVSRVQIHPLRGVSYVSD